MLRCPKEPGKNWLKMVVRIVIDWRFLLALAVLIKDRSSQCFLSFRF
jgi:hypothetical protein